MSRKCNSLVLTYGFAGILIKFLENLGKKIVTKIARRIKMAIHRQTYINVSEYFITFTLTLNLCHTLFAQIFP